MKVFVGLGTSLAYFLSARIRILTMHVTRESLLEINTPIDLSSISAPLYDGRQFLGERISLAITDGKIVFDKEQSQTTFSDDLLILPGGIDLHIHARDVWEDADHPVRGTEKDQTYKEDAYTASLALAQGGAIFGMCMPNLANRVVSREEYEKQVTWLNSALPHRQKPVVDLGTYLLIDQESHPEVERGMYKLLWNTFGPTNLPADASVPEVLSRYKGRWVTAHCETIADTTGSDTSLPHHEQRPTIAATNAVKIFLEAAKRVGFHAHVAHISSADEVALVSAARKAGLSVSCEVTPQAVSLDHETFSEETGHPSIFGQQNPPLRSSAERKALIEALRRGEIDFFATDHAPHTPEEKTGGMSGMPQASVAGQVYLKLVDEGVITLADFVRLRSTHPSEIVEKHLGLKTGRLQEGFDASFTVISRTPSRVPSDAILSRCGWSPYDRWVFPYTIEGVVIRGKFYSQKALQNLGC